MYVADQVNVDIRGGGADTLTVEDRARFSFGAAESRLQTVRDYLQREFPLATVLDSYDSGQAVHVFRLENDHGSLMHVALIAVEVLAAEPEGGLRAFFDRHRMFSVLYRAGDRPVSVTSAGIDLAR